MPLNSGRNGTKRSRNVQHKVFCGGIRSSKIGIFPVVFSKYL
jgi:hypothetical protein